MLQHWLSCRSSINFNHSFSLGKFEGRYEIGRDLTFDVLH